VIRHGSSVQCLSCGEEMRWLFRDCWDFLCEVCGGFAFVWDESKEGRKVVK